MKMIIKVSLLFTTAFLLYFMDLSYQPASNSVGVQFVSEAQAVLGVRRRAARRGVAVGYAAGTEAAAAASSAAAPPAQQAAPEPEPAAAPAAAPDTSSALPEGTVSAQLPDGCKGEAINGVEYQHCGPNYFRAVFQGNNLVYVTTDPSS